MNNKKHLFTPNEQLTKGIYIFTFSTKLCIDFYVLKKKRGNSSVVILSFYIGFFGNTKNMEGVLEFLLLIINFLIKKMQECGQHMLAHRSRICLLDNAYDTSR